MSPINYGVPKVIFFPVDHKDGRRDESIAKIFRFFHPSKNDLLLYEWSGGEITRKFSVTGRCWEKIGLVDQFKKRMNKFSELFAAASRLEDSSYSVKYRKKVALQIEQLIGRGKIISSGLRIERIFKSLDGDGSREYLKNAGETLSLLIGEAFEEFKDEFVIETFPERQQHLIKEIENSLRYKRVFVICGAYHADPEETIFPDEVNRLLDFLWAKEINFRIFNTAPSV